MQQINQLLNNKKKTIPRIDLTGELRGVVCEYLWENWPRHNNTALYITLTFIDPNFNKLQILMAGHTGCFIDADPRTI